MLGSLGKYGGPLWWTRFGPLSAVLGPHDPAFGQTPHGWRHRRPAGSLYHLLTIILPGFGSFRYPSKLLPFLAVSLAVLAGLGWDRLADGRGGIRNLARLSIAGLGLSLAGLVAAVVARYSVVAYLSGGIVGDSPDAVADMGRAWTSTQLAMAQGVAVFGSIWGLTRWVKESPQKSCALATVLLAVDLAVANRGLIWAVPQVEFETSFNCGGSDQGGGTR